MHRAEGLLLGLAAGALFYVSARSLQLGPAVEVIALTSVARFLAFCLVIAGAAFMPAQHGQQPDLDQHSVPESEDPRGLQKSF